MAKNETSFKKGNSGNPGGRPKGAKGFRQACRDLTPVALEALEDIITSKSNPQARTAAARVIIEHGYGRAIQTIENIDTQKDAGAALAAVRLALYGPEGEKAGKTTDEFSAQLAKAGVPPVEDKKKPVKH